MLLMLAACGGNASSRTTLATPTPTTPTATPSPPATPAATPSPSPAPSPAPTPPPTPAGGSSSGGSAVAAQYTVQDLGTADGFEGSSVRSVNADGVAAG